MLRFHNVYHRCFCFIFDQTTMAQKQKSRRTLYFSPTVQTFWYVNAIRKYEELSHPKNQKMYDLILVTLLKMRPHYSQSSRENATPSSGTCPLASYKEVSPRVLLAVTDISTTFAG